jgi:histidinol-phosphate aminotransferase
MSRFLNDRLGGMECYTPGEQPKDKKYIKLNTNESPYPPSEGVIEAINREAVENLRLYSDPTCSELRRAMAKVYGVGEGCVFLSNGSDDILNFAFMAYGHMGATFADITYGFYKVYASLYGVKCNIVPLRADFSQPIEEYFGKNNLVVIANPNAPTGEFVPLSAIEKIVESNENGVVLVDEAYVDFGGESAVNLIRKYKNLLCVGTFSKSRSLAGARLGFAIADESLIADLEKIKYSTNPYNINRLTQLAGLMAVKEEEYYKENCKKIIKTREYTASALKELGFLVLPSLANFIFAKSPEIGGEALYLALKEKGILVRHFTAERIKDFNRITIGTETEMQALVAAVKEIINR